MKEATSKSSSWYSGILSIAFVYLLNQFVISPYVCNREEHKQASNVDVLNQMDKDFGYTADRVGEYNTLIAPLIVNAFKTDSLDVFYENYFKLMPYSKERAKLLDALIKIIRTYDDKIDEEPYREYYDAVVTNYTLQQKQGYVFDSIYKYIYDTASRHKILDSYKTLLQIDSGLEISKNTMMTIIEKNK